jgi:hypothetical protein
MECLSVVVKLLVEVMCFHFLIYSYTCTFIKVSTTRHHSQKTAAALYRLSHEQCFLRIAGHGSAAFALWAPRLYGHYSDILQRLQHHDPSLTLNFRNSIFSCCTYNFGPRTVTLNHFDSQNYIVGWCAITALGKYDFTKHRAQNNINFLDYGKISTGA